MLIPNGTDACEPQPLFRDVAIEGSSSREGVDLKPAVHERCLGEAQAMSTI